MCSEKNDLVILNQQEKATRKMSSSCWDFEKLKIADHCYKPYGLKKNQG